MVSAAELRAAQAKAMSEDELAENVRAIAHAFNVLRYHTYRSTRSAAGFPDEVLIGSRTLFRELKQVGKSPTFEQRLFLTRLDASGEDVGVWTPDDLMSGRIRAEIAAIAVPR